MVGELFIYRGLPGSGKTTCARRQQASGGGRLVGRDHLRELLFGRHGVLTNEEENEVTKLQEKMIRDGLRAGQMVIVDDMNLRPRYVRRLMEIVRAEGALFEVIDLTDVPVEVCQENNRKRDRQVPPEVIDELYLKYVKGKGYPLPLPETTEKAPQGLLYTPKAGTPKAIIVDIDGTIAEMDGRSPYDYSRVSEDLPKIPVIRIVETYLDLGYQVLFTSGRPESCRDDTLRWLEEQFGLPSWVLSHYLFMRNTGDTRNDAIVKQELFDRHIRDHYDVQFVLDDRTRVVEMWRSLGLTCLQVAPGDF